MRVLCIGDSLGLPRDGVRYEDTWFYKLSKQYPQHDFISMFKRTMLISEAAGNLFNTYYTFYKPDVVIIQTGICDCSPRTFNQNSFWGKAILRICKFIGFTDQFWRVVKSRNRKPDRVYTSLDVFILDFKKLIDSFLGIGVDRIIVVKIGHGDQTVLAKSPSFNSNVDIYNAEIDRICIDYGSFVTIVDPLNKVEEDMFIDGYHCNMKGMDVVYRSLVTQLESIVNKE